MQKQTVLWLVFLNIFKQILSVLVAFWGRQMKQTDFWPFKEGWWII